MTITGETNGDDLTVTGGAPGEIVVTNNENAEVDAFFNVQRINIDLLGGNDVLTLTSIDISGGLLFVKLGADNDLVTATGIMDADVSLDGETGDDDIDLAGGVTVLGNLDIFGGIREDFIDISGAAVDGNLFVDAQGGDDALLFSGLTVQGRTRVDLGIGHDFASSTGALFESDVVIIAGLGDDDIFNSGNTYQNDLFVDLRGGDDIYDELGSFVGGDYTVDGGAGNDDFNDSGTVVLGSRDTRSV